MDAQRQALQATAAGARYKEAADALARLVQVRSRSDARRMTDFSATNEAYFMYQGPIHTVPFRLHLLHSDVWGSTTRNTMVFPPGLALAMMGRRFGQRS